MLFCQNASAGGKGLIYLPGLFVTASDLRAGDQGLNRVQSPSCHTKDKNGSHCSSLGAEGCGDSIMTEYCGEKKKGS